MSLSQRSDEVVHPHDISAVVCSYTEERWELLMAAIASLQNQRWPLKEIIVVADHNDSLLERLREEAPHVVSIANDGPQGLSGARNAGVTAASGLIIASLDDDAQAAPDWSARLAENFQDPAVAGVGCDIQPRWEKAQRAWFPPEFYWVVGCTYKGVPTERRPIRNPLGAGMALRKAVFEQVGGFRSDLGRLNKRPLGCEETELCVRVRQQDPKALFVQDPQARVSHYVPEERTTARYFFSRCFSEGLSKASVSRSVGSGDALAAERAYVTRVLPLGILAGLKSVLRGDLSGPMRASAIVAGLSCTALGYLVGTLSQEGQQSQRSKTIAISPGRPLLKVHRWW